MWSWFSPKCPVNLRDKVWVERRMRWLALKFGTPPLLETDAILPTPEFFPDKYSGELEDVQPMLNRICQFMQTAPTRFDLSFINGRPSNGLPLGAAPVRGAAGLYHQSDGVHKPKIEVSVETLNDPLALVATLAHEVAHDRLLGEGRVHGNEHDHEPLTDLTPVFFGLGIFQANAAFQTAAWRDLGFEYWKCSTLGYLKQEVFGYALAVRTWLRGEPTAKWASYLTTNPKSAFWSGLRYLQKTHDRVYDREVFLNGVPPSMDVRPDELLSSTDSIRMSALMALWDVPETSQQHVDAVVDNLLHDNPHIQIEATALLQNQSELSSQAIDRLVNLIRDGEDDVPYWAAEVLWQKLPGREHQTKDGLRLPDELISLSAKASKAQLLRLVQPLAAYGAASRLAMKPLLGLLQESLIHQSEHANWLIELLLEIEPQLEQRLLKDWPDTIVNLFRVTIKKSKRDQPRKR